MRLRFRNLTPELDETGQVIGAEFTDVTLEETMLLSWQEVVYFTPSPMYRAIKSAAVAECRALAADMAIPRSRV